MRLYLSDASPLNSTFSTEEGKALYKVDTPFKFAGRTANISTIVPDGIPGKQGVQGRFAHLAQVEWHLLESSLIRHGGQEVETDSFFWKKGWEWRGRYRVFTGPDGRDYRWELTAKRSTLVTNDEAKTRVARFHPKRYLVTRRPASLEIYPGGEGIMDTILITFIYVERIRKRENAASRSHGGGP